MPKAVQYWLFKSEPDDYSFDDLRNEKTATWEGVRNYQARNFMRSMKKGDRLLYYHSRVAEPGVVGTATVVKTAYPDPTQFDTKSRYYDAKSDPDNPRWDMVDIKSGRKLKRPVSLEQLKSAPGLEEMIVARRGNRLSITPVTAKEWAIVLKLGGL